jgi:hypothetical protein
MRGTFSRVAMAGAFISVAAFAVQEVDARGGGRGGGARGGGSTSMSRGGGGGGGGSFSRSGNYSRPSGGASASQRAGGGANRGGSQTAQRPSTGGSGTQRPSTRPGQGGSGTQRPGNSGNINSGNINTGNINTGNINRGDVNIDVDNDWNGWGGYYDHPVGAFAAGAVVGATTAAVLGSRYYALPTGCSPYPYASLTYYSCGGAWYQPTYQGDTVVYVVVDKPG